MGDSAATQLDPHLDPARRPTRSRGADVDHPFDDAIIEPEGPALRVYMPDRRWDALVGWVRATADDAPDSPAAPPGRRKRRRQPRHAVSLRCLMRLEAPAGGVFAVPSRDLSRGGLGFIHTQPLTPGRRCTVALQPHDGPGVVTTGAVAWCKPREGDDHFDVGLEFDRTIDITRFLHR